MCKIIREFAKSARRVPDTEEVIKQTTRQKPQKGARNGLQETRNSREERSKAVVRGWLPREEDG